LLERQEKEYMTTTLDRSAETSESTDVDYASMGTINVGTKLAMAVDPDSLANILESLTVMYADSHYAVIREYTSNAFDSHIMASSTKPVEVTLPSALNPELVIRDFGIGMSRAGIADVYSFFGKSTKRETAQQIGKFGLGSKSALAVAGGYTFTAIQDGKLNRVLVARNDEDIPEFNILDEVNTDLPNGVEVRIPATPDDIARYQSAVNSGVFFAWPKNTVLVNGSVPSTSNGSLWNTDKWTPLVEDKIWFQKTPGGSSYFGAENRFSPTLNTRILVGPVAYSINDPKKIEELDTLVKEKLGTNNNIKFNSKFVVRVPNRSVRFVPSRDTFVFDKATRETLADAIVNAINVYMETAKEAINKCDTYFDAVSTSLSFDAMLGVPHLYKGKAFGSLQSILTSSWYRSSGHSTRMMKFVDGRFREADYHTKVTKNSVFVSDIPYGTTAGLAGYASTRGAIHYVLLSEKMEDWDANLVDSENHVTFEHVTEIARQVRNARAAAARAARETEVFAANAVTIATYVDGSSRKQVVTPEMVETSKFVTFDMSLKDDASIVRGNAKTVGTFIAESTTITRNMQKNGYIFVPITKAQTLDKINNILGAEASIESLDVAIANFVTEVYEKVTSNSALFASLTDNVKIASYKTREFLEAITKEETREWFKIAFASNALATVISRATYFSYSFAKLQATSGFTKTVETFNKVEKDFKEAKANYSFPYPMMSVVSKIDSTKEAVICAEYVNMIDANN